MVEKEIHNVEEDEDEDEKIIRLLAYGDLSDGKPKDKPNDPEPGLKTLEYLEKQTDVTAHLYAGDMIYNVHELHGQRTDEKRKCIYRDMIKYVEPGKVALTHSQENSHLSGKEVNENTNKWLARLSSITKNTPFMVNKC
jgi:hypothetical protein